MAPVLLRNPVSRAVPGALAVALSLTLAACSSGGAKPKAESTPTTKPKVLEVRTSVLKVGSVDVESAGPSTPIPTATGRAVLAVAQGYIDDAIFAPLQTGKVGAKYPALFDAGVRAVATGKDEAALTNVGVGKATIRSTAATPVTLSSLDGTLGELMYVATDFDVVIKATSGTGTLTLSRHVELTYAQTGKTWFITAYRIAASNKSATGTTTTTATGGSTP